jgi:hypothetical protein
VTTRAVLVRGRDAEQLLPQTTHARSGFQLLNGVAHVRPLLSVSFGHRRALVRYEPIDPMSQEDAERAAASADPEEVLRAVLAVALHGEDLAWAEAFCERFARHPDSGVRGSALLGFGHLARRFRELDAARVRPLLEAGLADPDAWVRGQSDSAADDAEFFLGWRLRRP